MSALFWVNYLSSRTNSAQVYSIIHTGFLLYDYVNPVLNAPFMGMKTDALVQLISPDMTGIPAVLEMCMNDQNRTLIQCFNPENLVKYIQTPVLFIQSPYDPLMISEGLKGPVTCISGSKKEFQSL